MPLEKPDLDKPAFNLFLEEKARIREGKCATCNKEIKEEDFRDSRSKKEYSISGMCQECQDKVFGKGED